MRTKLKILACAFVGLLAATEPAFAADAKKPAAGAAAGGGKKTSPAEAAFKAGKKLFDAGNFHDAADKLEESYRLEPKTGKLLLLATAHDKDGRSATAWDEYKRVLDEAGKAHNKKLADAARAAIPIVFKKISYIKLEGISASVATIEIDGKIIDKSGWPSPQPFDSGPHDVKISNAAGKTKSVAMTLQPGPVTQSLALPPLDGDAAVAVATVAVIPESTGNTGTPAASTTEDTSPKDSGAPPKKGNTLRVVSYVLDGVGLVGIGLGTGFGLYALKDKRRVDDHCGAAGATGGSESLTSTAIPCDGIGYQAQQYGKSNGNISTVSFAVGGAALATGIVLFFVSRNPDKAEKTGASSIHFSPTVSLNGSGGGFELGGVF